MSSAAPPRAGDLRIAVARTSATLGSSARRRGRALVVVVASATPAGRLARAGLALGAGPIRTAGLLRRTPVNPRALVATVVDGLVHSVLHGRTVTLILEELRVSRELDINLRLQGPPERLRRVTGLALADTDGTVGVPTLRAQQEDVLWLSAVLPADRFRAPGSRSQLLLHGPAGTVRVRGGRTRLSHRWSRRQYQQDRWPVRVRMDWRHRLVVSGTDPATPEPAYVVRATPDRLTLTWDDPATVSSIARFTHRGTGTVVALEGARGPDGRHQVTLDLARLVDPVADWDVEVLTSAHGPVPLRSHPGAYPSMHSIVRFPEASATTRRGPVRAGLRLTAGNALVARVRPAASAG